MSVQWTLIATFLYVEVAILSILLLSIIKPEYWRKLFNSRFMKALAIQSNLYIWFVVGVLLIFLVDSLRENFKYGNKHHEHSSQGMYMGSIAYHEDQMRLFRAQRNLYIIGFALFNLFVIKRVSNLISNQAFLKIEADTLRKQAQGISKQASDSLAGPGGDDGGKLKKRVEELTKENAEYKVENEKLKKNIQAIKAQAEGTNKEFDRLSEEHAKLQNRLEKSSSDKSK